MASKARSAAAPTIVNSSVERTREYLTSSEIETLMAAERRLLQDVSHELRSPLARLGFAVELARTGGDSRFSLDRIKRDVDRLSSLVDDLLQLRARARRPRRCLCR